jgi:lysophospholipase L1-like esterase
MSVSRRITWTGAGVVGFLFGALAFSSVVCSQEKPMPSISKAQIVAAAGKRVVFAHQSVGNNILEGVNKIAREQGVAISTIDTRFDASGRPGIYHFGVGANYDPLSKISDFEKTMSAKNFDKVDVALVKLCFVDIGSGANAESIAETYVSTIKKLQEAHPTTRFVAVTSPLTVIPGGAKAWLKSALGRSPQEVAENTKRMEFNDYLRKQFDAEHLFDIAKLEAGATSGEIESLRPEFSDDGGHLNDRGQREIGAALLQFIARSN